MVDTTACTQIQTVLSELNSALVSRDTSRALDLFAQECYWRDLVAFTWNITTLEGKAEIRSMLDVRLEDVRPQNWVIDDEIFAQRSGEVTEGFLRFSTAVAHGYGYIRLKGGQIWTILTTMEDLKGYEDPVGRRRPTGANHNDRMAAPTWSEDRHREQSELGYTTQPYVLIVGGGHSGISLATRLRQYNVPTLIIDKNGRPGDNWRNRYRTLSLHNPIWENHMPYLNLPDNWPVFLHKDKFADWLEAYTKIMELNYWGATELHQADYDEHSKTWTVQVDRSNERITLRPAQLVLATGLASVPNVPDIPGQDTFAGFQQHSSQFTGNEDMENKRVVVIGSGTSAHDICADLAVQNQDVTMVQRSSTYIVRSETFLKHVLHPLYSEEAAENGITPDRAGVLSASVPYAEFFGFQKQAVDASRQADAEFYQALEKSGFLLDYGPGGSGLFGKAITGAYNYYIDEGASQLIIDGRIGLEAGLGVKELAENSVVLEDGRHIPADVVIYATGFCPMSDLIADTISPDVADKVGKIWGLGSGASKDPGPWEGELRNLWKPTQQEGLWLQGSLIAHASYYSRFLALQLKARMEGIPTPVYGLQEVHNVK